MTKYQIVAECAHATVESPFGPVVQLLYKGAFVPDSAPQLKHLLDNGYVVKVGDSTSQGLNADGVPDGGQDGSVPANLTTTPVAKSAEQQQAEREAGEKAKADAELEERRAAAQAKLAEVGEPDGRSSQAVWVEYMVARGGNYDDLKDVTKADLQKLAEQQK